MWLEKNESWNMVLLNLFLDSVGPGIRAGHAVVSLAYSTVSEI